MYLPIGCNKSKQYYRDKDKMMSEYPLKRGLLMPRKLYPSSEKGVAKIWLLMAVPM